MTTNPSRLEDLEVFAGATAVGNRRPLIKWAGGKRWLLKYLGGMVHPLEGRYFEPFLGGAAAFFALEPQDALIADSNPELMLFYQIVRDRPDDLIEKVSGYVYGEEFYYAMRETEPLDPVERAARFLYLNKTCWNGLYRVNQNGHFNVPFGEYDDPRICDGESIHAGSVVLKTARLATGDFESSVSDVRAGDFVYLDPPYVANHSSNGFTKYNEKVFKWADQVRLAALAHVLDNKGARVLITNAYHSSIVDLYQGFHLYIVERASRIAGRVQDRHAVTECVIANYRFGEHR